LYAGSQSGWTLHSRDWQTKEGTDALYERKCSICCQNATPELVYMQMCSIRHHSSLPEETLPPPLHKFHTTLHTEMKFYYKCNKNINIQFISTIWAETVEIMEIPMNAIRALLTGRTPERWRVGVNLYLGGTC
jgi:hypothetical protein